MKVELRENWRKREMGRRRNGFLFINLSFILQEGPIEMQDLFFQGVLGDEEEKEERRESWRNGRNKGMTEMTDGRSV